jgi:DNA-binding CsgD family transcriptional regulator
MDKHLAKMNYSAYQFVKATHDSFSAVCAPLYTLGIRRFRYTKIYLNGAYLTLDTSKRLASQYLFQIKSLGSLFIKELSLTKQSQSRILLPDSNINKFNSITDPILHLSHANNIWNSLHIIKAEKSYSEIYTFSMTRADFDAPNFYMNNLVLLERFSEYLKIQARDLINVPDNTNLAQFEQGFTISDRLTEDNLLEDKVKRFLAETALNRKVIKGKNGLIKLTPREIECLKHLALGKSVKQIAGFLDLSPRTIESYINKAKEKTGYTVRQKLINEFIRQKLNV